MLLAAPLLLLALLTSRMWEQEAVCSLKPYLVLFVQDGHAAQQIQDRLLRHHRAGRRKHQAKDGAVSK